MPIKSFVVPEQEAKDLGLKSINMHRLGRIVALAGQNGSGKSRILSKLEYYLSQRESSLSSVQPLLNEIKSMEDALNNNPENNYTDRVKAELAEAKKNLEQAVGRVICDHSNPLKPLKFVPKSLALADPHTFTIEQTRQNYAQAKTPGLDKYSSNCLSYIYHLQSQWWNACNPNQEDEESEKNKIIDDYEELQKIILKILKTKLGRYKHGEPMLFGQPITTERLSEGQNVLLQICVAIHAQNNLLSNTIFILDEPENHLHPSAVIDIFESIYSISPDSQIWVATHSVPLLAYITNIDPMSMWYVADGAVSNAGKNPDLVLKTLLGDQDGLQQLYNFTGLPSQLALTTYAAQSLLAPATIIYGAKDPQISQIQRMMSKISDSQPIKILDYGAGKGRLLSGLAAELADLGKKIEDHIDYYAFDPFTNDKNICHDVIKTFYPNDSRRLFNSPEDFTSSNQDACITTAVMCNVLHEIPPSEWLYIFSSGALLDRALKQSGYLLIVEDQRIPVGELAHPLGFLVLDTSHLRTLFAVTDEDINDSKFIIDDARKDGRLKAHLISKSLLSRISSSTVNSAIKQLRETAKNEIIHLRASKPTYSNGQLHGFWTQQFANASLYLDENHQ